MKKQMKEKFLFKDVFNEQLVRKMGANICKAYPEFDEEAFVSETFTEFTGLSLTERSQLIRKNLYKYLPKAYTLAIDIILSSFGEELIGDELSGFDGFYYMPFGNYISTYGFALEHYETSMNALYELTKRFTAEGAIRPFIRKYPEQTFKLLRRWVKDDNVHVRRLVSEGTRPKLPWASPLKEFQKDPSPVLDLLEKLKEDDELYVRRSVANSLNDIAKDHPDLVVKTLKSWSAIKNRKTQWIISHASRTLQKHGHPEVLKLLGYSTAVEIEINTFKLESDYVRMGEELGFSFEIQSKSKDAQKLMIDFVVYYMKANGKLASKVFKLTKKLLKAGEKVKVQKRISFKPISTRKYYTGAHAVQIQINGSLYDRLEFRLI